MHQADSTGDSPGTNVRKMAHPSVFASRRGSSSGGMSASSNAANANCNVTVNPTDDHQSPLIVQNTPPAGSSSPGPHRPLHSLNLHSQSQALQSAATQVKKKSGFQITSVLPAQVSASTNNSIADDTESYDDMDESHTEDLSSSDMLDVSVSRATDTGVHERSSSEETLNSLHGGETPGVVSPNEPVLHHALPHQAPQQQGYMVNGSVPHQGHHHQSHHHQGPHHQEQGAHAGAAPPAVALQGGLPAGSDGSTAAIPASPSAALRAAPARETAAPGPMPVNVTSGGGTGSAGGVAGATAGVPSLPSTMVGPAGSGLAGVAGSAQAPLTSTTTTTHTQTSTASRFRVVKLDSNTEPFRKGRWMCTEFYEKEAPPPAAATSHPVPPSSEAAAAHRAVEGVLQSAASESDSTSGSSVGSMVGAGAGGVGGGAALQSYHAELAAEVGATPVQQAYASPHPGLAPQTNAPRPGLAPQGAPQIHAPHPGLAPQGAPQTHAPRPGYAQQGAPQTHAHPQETGTLPIHQAAVAPSAPPVALAGLQGSEGQPPPQQLPYTREAQPAGYPPAQQLPAAMAQGGVQPTDYAQLPQAGIQTAVQSHQLPQMPQMPRVAAPVAAGILGHPGVGGAPPQGLVPTQQGGLVAGQPPQQHPIHQQHPTQILQEPQQQHGSQLPPSSASALGPSGPAMLPPATLLRHLQPGLSHAGAALQHGGGTVGHPAALGLALGGQHLGGGSYAGMASLMEDAQRLLFQHHRLGGQVALDAGGVLAPEGSAGVVARVLAAAAGTEEDSSSGASVVAIDNKIEQAMDLVKSHLMYAVREEVEVLKEQIKELIERNSLLEQENNLLKNLASPEQMAQFQAEVQTGSPTQGSQPGGMGTPLAPPAALPSGQGGGPTA